MWSLQAPFATLLLSSVPYTCVAVRLLSDIVAAGGDPKTEYYGLDGIDEDRYDTDLQAGVAIVTLQAGEEEIVYVPSTFIDEHPDVNGHLYRQMMIAIDLGPVPDNLNLSALLTKLQEVVSDYLGVTATVTEASVSYPTVVDDETHLAIEAAREELKTVRKSDHARLLEAQELLSTANFQITELQNYIIAQNAGPPAEL